MKHLFIVNPVAGGKKARGADVEREIRGVAGELGEPYEIYVTQGHMDACRKVAEEAGSNEWLRVYSCGGDGTLNECVNGAAGRANAAVTHYPCGTGNDFIRMFGKADEDRFRDLRALIAGPVRALDLIDCNGRYSINICSVGIDARIGTDVHKYSGIPLIGGATGYVVSLVVNLIKGVTGRFRISTVEGAGEEAGEGEYTLICACNGRFYGGGFNPVPDARPDDGIIDFLIVNDVSRLKFVQVVGKYAKGRYRELGDIITHVRGGYMKIDSDCEVVVNVDGEAMRAKSVSMRIIPDGVNFIFPPEMGFFG